MLRVASEGPRELGNSQNWAPYSALGIVAPYFTDTISISYCL
jgi:hypothetical protein